MPTQRPRALPPHRQRGFTLVEVMVVVVILGLLATMVAQNVTHNADVARVTRAEVDCKQIADAVRLYYSEKGQLPRLEELTAPDAKGRCYLEAIPLDPWGSAYVLREGSQPREFEVRSAGPNQQDGDGDDLSSRAVR